MSLITHPGLGGAGSKWVGNIPGHWAVGRLQHVASTRTSNVDKHSVSGETSVKLCNYTDVYKNDKILPGMPFMRATASTEQIERFSLRPGDTVITKDSETPADIGVPSYMQEPVPGLVCGYHLSIVRPRQGVADARFLFWVLSGRPTLRQWEVLAAGVTRVGLRSGDINRLTIAFPSFSEQVKIAAYLDRETAQIDALIEKQEQLMGVLRERRSSLVEAAFAAPTSIETRLIRLLDARPQYGVLVPRYAESSIGSVPLIRVGDLGRLSADQLLPRINNVQSLEFSRTVLRGGEVLLGVVGRMGTSAVVPDSLAGANVVRAVAVLRPRDGVSAELLKAWFGSRHFAHQAHLATAGDAVQPTLGMADLSRFVVRWPNDAMVALNVLRAGTAKIDALITKAEQFIALAKERRSALITAAVTGQIDVRGVL